MSTQRQTLTVQLMHAQAEIQTLKAELEALRNAALTRAHQPTAARTAYLQQQAARQAFVGPKMPSAWEIKCMAAREMAMKTGRAVAV